jgi:hypothetical protein
MVDERREDACEMLLVQHQQPVEALCPNGTHEPFRDAVCLQRSKRRPHDLNPFGSKHLIKGRSELLIAISNQESEGLWAVREGPRQLPGLLRDPGRRRRRRTASQMHAPTPQFDEEEDIQPRVV